MILRPDLSSAVMDPFCNLPQLILFCNIVDPASGQFYNRDPRSTAVLACEHLKASGIGAIPSWGPDAEFTVFDAVRYRVPPHQTLYFIHSHYGPSNTGADCEAVKLCHSVPVRGAPSPVPPGEPAK